MGFRVKRYGPHVTSFTDDSPGTVVVRALWKIMRPQPAITAPTANSTPPVITLARAAAGEMVQGRRDCRAAPRRYVRTNTHGTGTCTMNRMGFFIRDNRKASYPRTRTSLKPNRTRPPSVGRP